MEEDQIKYFEKIEAFVRGQLSDADRADFLEQMESDPQIKMDVETFTTADILIERNISNELKDQMNDWKAEESNTEPKLTTTETDKIKKPGVIKSLYKRLAYAATFLLLITAAGYMMSTNYSNQNLAANYDHPWSEDADVRGEMQEAGSTSYAIDKAFEDGNLDFLSQDDSPRSIYYHGLLLKNKKEYLSAIQKFESSLKNADAELKKHAEWQIIITSLLNKNFDQRSNELLEQVINDPSNMYNEDAKKMKKDLDSFWRKIF